MMIWGKPKPPVPAWPCPAPPSHLDNAINVVRLEIVVRQSLTEEQVKAFKAVLNSATADLSAKMMLIGNITIHST